MRGESVSTHSFITCPIWTTSGFSSAGLARKRNSWKILSIRDMVREIRAESSVTRSALKPPSRDISRSNICASSRTADIGLRKSCRMPFARTPEKARCSSCRERASRRRSRSIAKTKTPAHALKERSKTTMERRKSEETALRAVSSAWPTAPRFSVASITVARPSGEPTAREKTKTGC